MDTHFEILIARAAIPNLSAFEELKQAIARAEHSTGPRKFEELISEVVTRMTEEAARAGPETRALLSKAVLAFVRAVILDRPDLHYLLIPMYNTHCESLCLEGNLQEARDWLMKAYRLLEVPRVRLLDRVTVFHNLGVLFAKDRKYPP
jgi:hypothetical protein